MGDALQEQGEVVTLVNEQATKSAFFEQLRFLRDNASSSDLVILSLSGHGITDDKERFYFLPHGYDANRHLRDAAISWKIHWI